MNYNEKSRTNYFSVKDQEALDNFVDLTSARIDREGDKVCLLFEEGVPPTVEDEDTGDDIEIDFADEVSKFLADGEILVLQGSGSEGMRSISGWATAYNSKGDLVTMNIDDIYAKAAKKFGKKVKDITRAEN